MPYVFIVIIERNLYLTCISRPCLSGEMGGSPRWPHNLSVQLIRVNKHMSGQKKIYYRYRRFNTNTLAELCNDALYFSHPGDFNDPMDCKPTVECDSDLEELRQLVSLLIQNRVLTEVLDSLRRAYWRGGNAMKYARRRGEEEAKRELANLAYLATDPERGESPEDAEIWLLTNEVQSELRQHYRYGICCFTESYTNPLLWSHYADQHQGLCIGYSTERKPPPKLHKVTYGGSRTICTSKLARAFVKCDPSALDEVDQDVLLRKATGWSYEREWRLIGEVGEQESSMLLKEVTFGLRCPLSIKHAIVQALQGRDLPVRFYEMLEDRGKYALRRKVLDEDEFALFYPKTAYSAEELFGIDEEVDEDK